MVTPSAVVILPLLFEEKMDEIKGIELVTLLDFMLAISAFVEARVLLSAGQIIESNDVGLLSEGEAVLANPSDATLVSGEGELFITDVVALDFIVAWGFTLVLVCVIALEAAVVGRKV